MTISKTLLADMANVLEDVVRRAYERNPPDWPDWETMFMTDKCTKEEVDYRRASDTARCGVCTMFREPNRCVSVEGLIRAEDTCDLFKRKKDAK